MNRTIQPSIGLALVLLLLAAPLAACERTPEPGTEVVETDEKRALFGTSEVKGDPGPRLTAGYKVPTRLPLFGPNGELLEELLVAADGTELTDQDLQELMRELQEEDERKRDSDPPGTKRCEQDYRSLVAGVRGVAQKMGFRPNVPTRKRFLIGCLGGAACPAPRIANGRVVSCTGGARPTISTEGEDQTGPGGSNRGEAIGPQPI